MRHPALARLMPALLLATAASAALADEALTYDANGNITTRALSTPLTATATATATDTAPAHTTTFGYDPLDRLSSEAGPARTQSFTLDANGNRLSDGQGSKTYSPNSNRMATLDGHSVVLDAAGHTLQARGLVFAWNQAGQLKSVSQGPTLLASYFYDHRGLRTRKTTTAAAAQGAGTVIYHHDAQGHLLAETTAAGAPLRTYVWREDTPQALIVHAGGSNKVLYLQTDHLGSPIAARDHSGRLVWKWHSDAFGASAPDEDPDGDGTPTTIHLRFPGQYFDAESALHYNWHRYYDPSTGRYLSPDPIGIEGGSNLYAYVGGNPTSRIDPYGLWEFVFNAGFHLPAFPLIGVSGGPSAGSTWTPGQGLSGASFSGVAGEAVIGSIADAGVSAGIGGLSSCKDGKPLSLNLGLGRYGGVQLNFMGSQFDGITIGIGVGVSLPVSVTVPAK